MDRDYWLQKWQIDDIGFHQESYNRFLIDYLSTYPQGDQPRKVFVPLCGKSKDMLYLVEQGFEVFGVELSEKACEAFFSENGLKYKRSQIPGYEVFTGDKITLWCGDYFKLTSQALKGIPFIYDRAALIALPKEMRSKYVQHLQQMVSDVRILLLTVDYPQDRVQGPPFAVSRNEVEDLYGDQFEIRTLVDGPVDKKRLNVKFEGVEVFERVYELSHKSGIKT